MTDEEFLLKSLKYLHLIYKKTFNHVLEKPIYEQQTLPNYMQTHIDSLFSVLQNLVVNLILEKDGSQR